MILFCENGIYLPQNATWISCWCYTGWPERGNLKSMVMDMVSPGFQQHLLDYGLDPMPSQV